MKNYIIQVKIPDGLEKSEQIEEALEKYVKGILNNPGTFEVFDSFQSRSSAFQSTNNKPFYLTRFCSIDNMNAYLYAFISNFDFNHEIGEYFVEVTADDKFNPNGKFYPRVLTHHSDKTSENEEGDIRIVGLDYIVKGGATNEN